MELKLKKICKPEELKVGHRYSLTSEPILKYTCIVFSKKTTSNAETFYYCLHFQDGTSGGVYSSDKDFTLYEFPFTPLEQELM